MNSDAISETQEGMVNKDINKHMVSRQTLMYKNHELGGGMNMGNQVRTAQ